MTAPKLPLEIQSLIIEAADPDEHHVLGHVCPYWRQECHRILRQRYTATNPRFKGPIESLYTHKAVVNKRIHILSHKILDDFSELDWLTRSLANSSTKKYSPDMLAMYPNDPLFISADPNTPMDEIFEEITLRYRYEDTSQTVSGKFQIKEAGRWGVCSTLASIVPRFIIEVLNSLAPVDGLDLPPGSHPMYIDGTENSWVYLEDELGKGETVFFMELKSSIVAMKN